MLHAANTTSFLQDVEFKTQLQEVEAACPPQVKKKAEEIKQQSTQLNEPTNS